jgi:hypothetical protein
MSLRIEHRDGRQARKIIIGVLTSRRVCGAVADRWDGKLFDSRWANLIVGWAVDYYRKYRKAPGKDIQPLFDEWARKSKDKDTVGLAESFLTSLSGQWVSQKKAVRPDYVIDLAAQYFNQVKLRKLKEELDSDLETGNVEKAMERAKGFKEVEMGLGGDTVRVLEDKEAIKAAFDKKTDVLVRYPDALGTFFGDALERDGFISFEGPEKRGKTWILLDLAWQAMTQGRRVAFFEVGDLSKHQIMRRFMIRASRRPWKPGTVRIPVMMGPPDAEGGRADIQFKEKEYKNQLSFDTAWRKCEGIVKKRGEDLLRLSVHANSSISVTGISSILDGWRRWDGWVPDVVVDYFDILANMTSGKFENSREAVDATWRAGRRLSQEWHVLLVTASQTDADSYESDIITMSNFSQSKSKRAHTTGTAGINQTEEEKADGVYRFNWVAGREWEYSSSRCVYSAGCLGIASPLMLSTFAPQGTGFRGKPGVRGGAEKKPNKIGSQR